MSARETILNSNEDLEFLLELKKDFFIETNDSINQAEQALMRYETNKDELALLEFKRVLHSIKGSAKAVDENAFALLVHKVEDRITGEKNEEFFDISYRFLDLSKEYLSFSVQGNTNSAAEAIGRFKF